MRRIIFLLFRKARLLAVLGVLDITFFGLTDPSSTNSLMIILAGILLGLTAYSLIFLLISLFGVLIPSSHRTRKRVSAFAALLLMFLILMQSTGQLSFRDVLAAVPLAVALYLYATYISKDKVQNI